jgi:hypothetical protein
MRDIVLTWHGNRDFVKHLAATGAPFIIGGSTATKFHAPTRADPNDLDLIAAPTPEVHAALNETLARLGGTEKITATAADFARANQHVPLKTRLLDVDVFTPPPGVAFAELWETSIPAQMIGSTVAVRVASIPSLTRLLQIARDREPTKREKIDRDLALLAVAATGTPVHL